MFYIASVIVLLYSIFVVACALAWLRHKPFVSPDSSEKTPSLAVVVCCRNEEERLAKLLASLAPQAGDAAEIIFANDHSSDRTKAILETFTQQFDHVRVFDCIGNGKKNALKEAIASTSSPLIFCTDADCELSPQHLKTVAAFMQAEQCDLAIGAVRMAPTNTFFEALQATEFSSLAASTAGAALLNNAIMCNGANLAFTRQTWEKGQQHLNEQQQSGDDVFLLHHTKHWGGKIGYIKSRSAIATTSPAPNIRAFFEQRKRWGSKSVSYTDKTTIAVALLVAATSLILAVYAPFSLFSTNAFCHFFVLFISKLLIDALLLIPFMAFSGQKKLIPLIIPVAIIYPFYIVITTIGALFGSFKWK